MLQLTAPVLEAGHPDVPCTDCLFDCVEFTVFLLWASVLHALNNILGVVMNAFIYMNVRVYIISRNGVCTMYVTELASCMCYCH